jgi:hypothetical protein
MDFLAEYKSKHGEPPNILPDGVMVLNTDSFFIQTEYPEDTLVDQVVLGVRGREVKVLRYDEDDDKVYVCFGKKIKLLNTKDVIPYVLRNFA